MVVVAAGAARASASGRTHVARESPVFGKKGGGGRGRKTRKGEGTSGIGVRMAAPRGSARYYPNLGVLEPVVLQPRHYICKV